MTIKHSRHNRREFINVTGAALAGMAGAGRSPPVRKPRRFRPQAARIPT